MLEEKAKALFAASNLLQDITSEIGSDKSIPWKTVMKLIEVYNMTEKLEHDWVKEIFTPDELREYAQFEAEFKSSSASKQRESFEKSWSDLVGEIKKNLNNSPDSKIGAEIGERCMLWVNNVYGTKYAHLRTKKFEQGFAKGKGLSEVGLTPEMVAWMDQAMNAYWKKRIEGILDQVGKIPENSLRSLWNEMLNDMYGDNNSRKSEVYPLIMESNKISPEAKKWLKNLSKETQSK